MFKLTHLIRTLVVLTILVVCALTAIAQTGTSRISGTVRDAQGAVVPGATVTAKNDATGLSSTQITNDSGLYAFTSLPVGDYTVTVEKSGFKTLQKTKNTLQVGEPLTVDGALEVGAVSETVTVTGGAEQLQTANATMGNVVEQKAIEALPLNGRNPLTLLLLEPGVVQRSAGAAGSGVHVNGARDRAYNVTIDGIEANESSVPNPVSNLYRINPDNVQEFKVTTNNATAEEGRNSGASISIATRSGTSEYHGTGFGFFRNEAFNSNEFFANAQKTPKPKIRMFQYGFEMGGPIKKNKTFFFGGVQQNRVDFTQPIDQTFGIPIVYTPQARSGIFRYFVPDPANPLVINGSTITRNSTLLVDPSTGALNVPLCATATSLRCVRTYDIRSATNNPNNIAGRTFDSAVAAILTPLPSPNSFTSGDGLNTAAFLWNPPTSVRGPAYSARIDHNFNANNSMFGRYLWSDYNTLKGDPLNGRPQVYPDGPALGEVFRRTSNLAISYRRVISPSVVNEFTAGFARFGFLFTQGEANPKWPDVPPFDFNNISEPYINTPRTARWVTTPQLLDNLSIVHGTHVFRGGVNLRYYRHVDQRGQPGGINVTPSVTFASGNRDPFSTAGGAFLTASGINSTDATTLGGLINNLYGLPARISQTFISNLNQNVFLPFKTGNNITLYAEKHNLDQYNFYFQDEWKLRPNLTLNYGARWEINPPGNTSGDQVYVASTPIVGTPLPAAPVVNAPGAVAFVKAKHWYEGSWKTAIGPRFGLAWSPDFKSGVLRTVFGDGSKSVIRLGYGLAFDTISSFQITAAAGRIPGLVQSCTTTFPFTTITAGCVNSPGVGNTVVGGFPQQLPAPSVQPATLLIAPQQLRSNSPPVTVFDPNMKLPTVHEWNFSIQRELPGGFVMQAAYIGRRGERLFMAYDANQINATAIVPSFLIMQQNRVRGCTGFGTGTGCPAGVTGVVPALLAQLQAAGGLTLAQATTFLNSSTTGGELDINSAGSFARRIEDTTLVMKLRPNQQFAAITKLDNSGDSNYHAAQITLRRRFSTGLGLSMAYTFGKSIDNQSVDPVGASSGGGLSTTNSRTPTDIRNFRDERGRSDFDRTQVLQAATVWELPIGKGRQFLKSSKGVVNHVLGGWTINSIFTFQTGEPFAIRSGSFTANGNHESRAGVQAPVTAQLQTLPGQSFAGPVLFKPVNALTCGVDLTQAFCLPAPGQNGAGRNIFVAPHYWNLDLGFIKMFQLTERFKLQFRMEMFNALNHPNFDNPRDASVGSPSIRSSVFAQTCCATVAPPSTQTIVQTGESARVIQFAMKLQF